MSTVETTVDAGERRSWWLAAVADPAADQPPVEGELTADVCIVGGGYTGLWTALRIKQQDPAADVVIVEAETCGSGASGRNGGCAMTLWHHFTALQRICGTAEARWLALASVDAVAEIGRFCDEHRIDAGYRADGWLWTATNAAQVGRWQTTIDAIARAGEHPFVPVSREELEARSGSQAHIAGVFEASAASIQPAALARGLRRVALEHGVRIYERSPMVELERTRPLVVRTANGRVVAGRVVLAMNAWSVGVREMRNAMAIVSSDLAITEPVPELLAGLGIDDGVCVSDSRLMVHYYRTTPDGRLALGRGGDRIACGARIDGAFQGRSPRTAAAWIAESIHRLYPQLASVPIADTWCGPIDRPVDGLPFFAELGREDLICGAGFSGNGVVPCVLAGRILASMALGADDEWSRCGLVRPVPGGLPPEPIRSVGGRMVRRAVLRQEAREDAGRRPSPLVTRVAALAPAGLVPTR